MSEFVAGLALGALLGLIFGPSKERLDAANYDGWLTGYDFGRGVDPQIADIVRRVARGETESQGTMS